MEKESMMAQRIAVVMLLLLAFAAPSGSWNTEQVRIPRGVTKTEYISIKPDLLVESIDFSESISGTMLTLSVTGWITNDSSVNSGCCPTEAGQAAWAAHPALSGMFEWKKYVRNYPNGAWTQIGGAVSTLLRPHERQSYIFTDTMPLGTQREYKIVLDPANWIQESDTKNNTKMKLFPGK